ncbi:hypothetical protein BDQ12DRAFT_651297 [Crucibulum laeve]|uniref:Fe2OG dioxygenase domain-containing protein n=1 Tax=Crucibulum laeve TaxID=68775 RepID=A0A5C3LZQ1_9AGAR|nr:hypothetical protein BDQ12DRAFT_651297 [Crucibulum laeve]
MTAPTINPIGPNSTLNSSSSLPQAFHGKANRPVPRPKHPKPIKAPELGPGDSIGAGDSYLVTNLLPDDLAETAFEMLKEEVRWETMFHRGGEVPRLVAVEGEVSEDGSFPVYRHPADESPALSQFTPTVAQIRDHVQKVIKHPVNHALIQYYRSGKDYISEHSDKTIDVVRGSNIVNVSLGAQRVMTLRMKKDKEKEKARSQPADAKQQHHTPRPAQRVPLPHNSMFVMGASTNAQWLHGINHDNRPLHTKSPSEQLHSGGRISLTFRHIGTFLSSDEKLIWGQGGKGKTREEARRVVNGGRETERLIWAFGEENQRADFDWVGIYGEGFDVLHFKEAREES